MKKFSDLDATEYNGIKQLKPNERTELIGKIVKSRERYPVRNYVDMKVIHSIQQQLLTNSLFACAHILGSEDEGLVFICDLEQRMGEAVRK